MNTNDKEMRNISFKINEADYEAIKKFAKEKRQKNLKSYILWLAKEDMKQPDFEIDDDDTQAEQMKKLQNLIEIQKQEIEKYKKILTTIEFAMENYNK